MRSSAAVSYTHLDVYKRQFQNRYNGSVKALRELLASGELGGLKMVRANVLWHREAPYYTQSGWRGSMETEGGGTLINQSIHTLDLMLYTVGPAKRVKGTTSIDYLKGVIDVEESVHAVLEYANGARGLIHCSNSNAIDAPIELEYILEKGTLLPVSYTHLDVYKRQSIF